jgi:hypothetical protein
MRGAVCSTRASMLHEDWLCVAGSRIFMCDLQEAFRCKTFWFVSEKIPQNAAVSSPFRLHALACGRW